MSPSELKRFLEARGIQPLKSRSQHFLLDDGVVVAMVDAAEVGPGARVLEVGPGPGILTAELLKRGCEVVAVELDSRLCEVLHDRFDAHPAMPRLALRCADALSFANAEYQGMFPSGPGEYCLVANLPYAITSPLLQKFILEEPAPARMVVMVQKEVGDRLVARAARGDMSSLGVMAQTYCRAHRVCDIAPSAFLPPPQVDSSAILLVRKSPAEIRAHFGASTPDRYFALVRAAFAAPRKQVRNTLRAAVPDTERLEAALKAAGIDPMARPETITVEAWSALANALA